MKNFPLLPLLLPLHRCPLHPTCTLTVLIGLLPAWTPSPSHLGSNSLCLGLPLYVYSPCPSNALIPHTGLLSSVKPFLNLPGSDTLLWAIMDPCPTLPCFTQLFWLDCLVMKNKGERRETDFLCPLVKFILWCYFLC